MPPPCAPTSGTADMHNQSLFGKCEGTPMLTGWLSPAAAARAMVRAALCELGTPGDSPGRSPPP